MDVAKLPRFYCWTSPIAPQRSLASRRWLASGAYRGQCKLVSRHAHGFWASPCIRAPQSGSKVHRQKTGAVAACQGVVTPQLHTGARGHASHPMEMARALVSPTAVGAHGSKPLHSLILSPEHVRL